MSLTRSLVTCRGSFTSSLRRSAVGLARLQPLLRQQPLTTISTSSVQPRLASTRSILPLTKTAPQLQKRSVTQLATHAARVSEPGARSGTQVTKPAQLMSASARNFCHRRGNRDYRGWKPRPNEQVRAVLVAGAVAFFGGWILYKFSGFFFWVLVAGAGYAWYKSGFYLPTRGNLPTSGLPGQKPAGFPNLSQFQNGLKGTRRASPFGGLFSAAAPAILYGLFKLIWPKIMATGVTIREVHNRAAARIEVSQEIQKVLGPNVVVYAPHKVQNMATSFNGESAERGQMHMRVQGEGYRSGHGAEVWIEYKASSALKENGDPEEISITAANLMLDGAIVAQLKDVADPAPGSGGNGPVVDATYKVKVEQK